MIRRTRYDVPGEEYAPMRAEAQGRKNEIKLANNAKTRIVFNVVLKLVWDTSSPFRK